MTSRRAACVLLAFVLSFVGGCGDSAGGDRPARRIQFVGFDASDPLVEAMKQGKLQAIVVQNPFRMGELGVKTLVQHLEGKPVEAKVSTGETLVTPENMNDPEIRLLIHPPRAENRTEGSLAGGKSKKWRVMVIPKGTTHE